MIKVVSGYSISSQNSASPSAAEGAKRLANMTNPNHTEYCDTRGYELLHFDEHYNWDIKWECGWQKIFLFDELLNDSKYEDTEWFFWIDTDAIFMNYNTKLESLVDDWSFFSVCRDCNGINVGTFFIKNCDRSREFIRDLIDDGPLPGAIFENQGKGPNGSPHWWNFSEQGSIDRLGLSDKYRSGFSVRPNRAFNSYVHDCIHGILPSHKYQKGDFLIHLPGVPNKEAIIQDLLPRVIKDERLD